MFVLKFKNKGNVQSCGNYRGIKFMRYTVEDELRAEVSICEKQCGFMTKKRTTDAAFALRMLIEKY